jgi:hypothetical protein
MSAQAMDVQSPWGQMALNALRTNETGRRPSEESRIDEGSEERLGLVGIQRQKTRGLPNRQAQARHLEILGLQDLKSSDGTRVVFGGRSGRRHTYLLTRVAGGRPPDDCKPCISRADHTAAPR